MFIHIKILTKNLNSLKRFLIFLKYLNTNKKNINGFLKYLKKRTKKNIFTILKSPHVNKTAQEQIEYRLFSKQVNIFSFQILKFIILIKKIQKILFPDLNIQLKLIINKKQVTKKKLIALDPNNYTLKKMIITKNQKTLFYLNLFDIYGELNFDKKLFR